jgi:hypothetical protein
MVVGLRKDGLDASNTTILSILGQPPGLCLQALARVAGCQTLKVSAIRPSGWYGWMGAGQRYSHPVDRINTNVLCDQTGVLTVFYSSKDYPAVLRRVVVRDETGKRITFLTNHFALGPEMIAALYRQRWQVELFFKWIKQHLRIKAFLGTSENAVKTQICIAVCTYVLIAIVKKRLHLPHSLYEILQILSLTMFETTPINQLLTPPMRDSDSDSEPQQLALL